MKDLIKIALGLAALFASTFVVIRMTGILAVEDVRLFLTEAHSTHPVLLFMLVVTLLWIDLLIAIPTMAIILVAGYFLGPVWGASASVTGLMAMGVTGYAIGRSVGRPALSRMLKDKKRLAEMERSFARNDLLSLFVCQALPILPELCCCLAGIGRMKFQRFLFGYAVGVIPFAIIVAYGGSISSIEDPGPAIYAAIGVSVTLLLLWRLLQRQSRPPIY